MIIHFRDEPDSQKGRGKGYGPRVGTGPPKPGTVPGRGGPAGGGCLGVTRSTSVAPALAWRVDGAVPPSTAISMVS